MVNSIVLSGLLMFGGQSLELPNIWKKIEGKWSYVGEVKEKTQILMWIEKTSKTTNNKIFIKCFIHCFSLGCLLSHKSKQPISDSFPKAIYFLHPWSTW